MYNITIRIISIKNYPIKEKVNKESDQTLDASF